MALAGFGGDSLIEVTSASLVLWRFRGDFDVGSKLATDIRKKSDTCDWDIVCPLSSSHCAGGKCKPVLKVTPDTTLPGLIVSLVSLSFMFVGLYQIVFHSICRKFTLHGDANLVVGRLCCCTSLIYFYRARGNRNDQSYPEEKFRGGMWMQLAMKS